MSRYGILGGGWAGLLVANEIRKIEPEAEIDVLEKNANDNLGGLLRSVTIDGFTYDIGGPHILFSKNPSTLSSLLEILGDNSKKMERKNFVHFEGKLVPYPFENGIYLLPPEDRAKLGLGIIQNLLKMQINKNWVPESFYDWIYNIFGQEMGSRYLEPYNKKIWKRDLKNFDASWVFTPGRLPLPQLKDIVYSVSGIETIGYKEQAYFYYPKSGGIQTLYDSLYKHVYDSGTRIVLNTEVESVRQNSSGHWVINDTFQYDRVINTLPPITFLAALGVPTDKLKLASELDHNRVVVVGFALDQPTPDRIALYVPQEDVVFHRYTWMSNLVSDSPIGKSNLIVEITIPHDKTIDTDSLIKQATDGLLKVRIIDNPEKIIHTQVWVHEFGYPVYTKGHNELRREIMNYINSLGIFSVGRWGSWHYWNTDKVYEAVVSMCDKMFNKGKSS